MIRQKRRCQRLLEAAREIRSQWYASAIAIGAAEAGCTKADLLSCVQDLDDRTRRSIERWIEA